MNLRRSLLFLPTLLCLLTTAVTRAPAEEVIEVWRSPFGTARSVSVSPTDGSCWVATGGSVMHLAADGTLLGQVNRFCNPQSVSVNPADGSCWVADGGELSGGSSGPYYVNSAVVHLSASGAELWRGGGFDNPCAVSANPTDGSCWVADPWSTQVVHLSASGAELWRGGSFSDPCSVSANPTDGSCWVADGYGQVVHLSASGTQLWSGGGSAHSVSVNPADGSCWVVNTANYQVVHLSASGAELWRGGEFLYPLSVSVNPGDGSCWVADGGEWSVGAGGYVNSVVVHLSASGAELWRGGEFSRPESVSTDPTDGSCWAADPWGRQMVHLSASGAELWRGKSFSYPRSVSANSTDGSCWVADGYGAGDDNHVVHLGPDGAELWRGGGFSQPRGVSVNPHDGSCWVADAAGNQLVHLGADGTELSRTGDINDPYSVSVNPVDASCWADSGGSSEIVHLAANGSEIWRGGGFYYPECVSVNPSDGSCWVADTDHHQVVHLAAGGTEIWRGDSFMTPCAVSVNPSDGSCWVVDRGLGELIHLAANAAVLWRGGDLGFPESLSANPMDGSCWVGDPLAVVHVGSDGAELWRGSNLIPSSVSVNPTEGSCWVADSGNGQVVKLAIPASFSDVPYYHWALGQIEACVNAGVVSGYGDETYQPSLPVTRDQMAAYISRALAGGDENVPDPSGEPTFPDVLAGDWGYKHIEYAAAQNVVAGYQDGLYHPEYEVTRDQMAVYVARAMVAPTGEAALADYAPADPRNFLDVPHTGCGDDGTDPYWAYKHIEYCVENSVVQGYLDGLYHPEYVVTRDQMAVYVARAFDLTP